MKEILEEIFKKDLGKDAKIGQIDKLHGDASYRTYYRANLLNGQTYIIMQMPEGKASASEEITNFNGTHKELPFVNVERYLKSCAIPVPSILHYSDKHHLMILEDLGDNLMAREVANADEGALLKWYRKAIDLLCFMQQKTSCCGRNGCVAFKRSFDETLLNWEFDHFLEYGIEARLGLSMSSGDAKAFQEETRAISTKIKKMQYGFTHRDFQSRNLIIRDGHLYLIDFQDSLLGPKVYDFVALTRDSYVKLPDNVLLELIGYYSSESGQNLNELRKEFDLVTVQRKLKDAGRFVYIDRVKGNPNFLQYIPTSLGYVKSALERLPEHSKLYEVLKKYVPDWK